MPAQIVREKGKPEEALWTKPLPNDMKNANGFRATQDKRNAGSGWGHVTAAPPIVVGKHIYWPTMAGVVYVVDWTAPRLNERRSYPQAISAPPVKRGASPHSLLPVVASTPAR